MAAIPLSFNAKAAPSSFMYDACSESEPKNKVPSSRVSTSVHIALDKSEFLSTWHPVVSMKMEAGSGQVPWDTRAACSCKPRGCPRRGKKRDHSNSFLALFSSHSFNSFLLLFKRFPRFQRTKYNTISFAKIPEVLRRQVGMSTVISQFGGFDTAPPFEYIMTEIRYPTATYVMTVSHFVLMLIYCPLRYSSIGTSSLSQASRATCSPRILAVGLSRCWDMQSDTQSVLGSSISEDLLPSSSLLF